ncbi:hypothetical protein FRC08_001860 [Ceratobasidium sp. 394]|nr:hypothetical protein FRC08_001860 [Ceratobasidium sp. 394]KAG9090258.1 hypothetical protein FS749_000695 [Ceratobasidium sp. UAMH 11750]
MWANLGVQAGTKWRGVGSGQITNPTPTNFGPTCLQDILMITSEQPVTSCTPTSAQPSLSIAPQRHRKDPPRRRASTAPPSPPVKCQKTHLHTSATLPGKHAQETCTAIRPAPASSPTDTPLRLSSASRPQSHPTQPQHSSRSQAMTATLVPQVAEEAKQCTESLEQATLDRMAMEEILRKEINLVVYEYLQFCDEILGIADTVRHDTIVNTLAANPLFNYSDTQWTFNCQDLQGSEDWVMHDTVARILDAIRQAAFSPDAFRPVHRSIIPLHGEPKTGVISAETCNEYVKQRRTGLSPDDEACGTTRTGTPAFISAELLLAPDHKPMLHTFLHDLESIFWVLIWAVVTHVEPGKRPSIEAEKFINDLWNTNHLL